MPELQTGITVRLYEVGHFFNLEIGAKPINKLSIADIRRRTVKQEVSRPTTVEDPRNPTGSGRA